MNTTQIEQKAEECLRRSFEKHIRRLYSVTFEEAKGENGYKWIYEAMIDFAREQALSDIGEGKEGEEKCCANSCDGFKCEDGSVRPKNKQAIRNLFYKECVDKEEYNQRGSIAIRKVINLTPHNLFEWFWAHLANLKREAEELRQRLIDKIEQNRIGYASLYAGNKLTDKDWRLIYEEAIKDWLDEVPKEELRQRVKDLEAGEQ